MTTPLKFQPFTSAVEAPFWHILSQKKLNEFKLDESVKPIKGRFVQGKSHQDEPAIFYLETNAFDQEINRKLELPGHLYILNTIESFKSLDKNKLLSDFGTQLWESIQNDEISTHPTRLSSFILITFADLKKYKFYYWFAFPAFSISVNVLEMKTLESTFDHAEIRNISAVIMKDELYFVLRKNADGTFTCHKLSDVQGPFESLWFCFIDPSSKENVPGWPLRNYLVYIKKRFGLQRVSLISVREGTGSEVNLFSPVIDLELPNIDDKPQTIGWELNSSGKPGARVISLSHLMDPHSLASTAVSLNLKLMKWRVAPDLELNRVASQKCLLLGAGTLGTHVARALLGWGVTKITFVDNSRVSYSNPVRQPLFEFQDCLDQGKPKAECAAAALKRIYPADSYGIEMTIPMPGHSVAPNTKTDIERLETQIKEHDVIFLLTDSRESRWLPTLLASYHKKIVINAALGFDTFLVMRHGMKDSVREDRLGCYFCNDVVAPTDSLKERTLDQQCTVTRPGISGIAANMAVELMTSILSHPQGPYAEAHRGVLPTNGLPTNASTLGLVPHQIRGFLSHFQQLLMVGKAYEMCTACSPQIHHHYSNRGIDFVLEALNEPSKLEAVTGLDTLNQGLDDFVCEWDE